VTLKFYWTHDGNQHHAAVAKSMKAAAKILGCSIHEFKTHGGSCEMLEACYIRNFPRMTDEEYKNSPGPWYQPIVFRSVEKERYPWSLTKYKKKYKILGKNEFGDDIKELVYEQ